MALYTTTDFDLNAVGIPLTGVAAFAPVTEANVIPDTDLGSPTITLPAAYRSLGLYKEDGGPQDERDDDDALEFFQDGYKLPGNSTVTVQIGLAEDNLNVNALIENMDMREAQRSYEANLNMVTLTNRMVARTIDILKA